MGAIGALAAIMSLAVLAFFPTTKLDAAPSLLKQASILKRGSFLAHLALTAFAFRRKVIISLVDSLDDLSKFSLAIKVRELTASEVKEDMVALWPVDDRKAMEFIIEFYRYWLSNRLEDPGKALCEVKRQCVTSGDPNRSIPSYWAPFVMFETGSLSASVDG